MLRVPWFRSLRQLVETLRRRVVATATAPFAHAPYPLAGTLEYDGDPGLLGPESVSWMVLADVAAFVGGVRSLLVQAAHPEVVAGVGDHSRYREDPLGRLSRTSAYVTATTYGAMPEVEAAVRTVRRVHRRVSGVSSRGVPYDASDPAFSAWVHNALTDSFLVAHQAYGGARLDPGDQDRFVMEQTKIGTLLGADPMPPTAVELATWVVDHPEVAPSPEMEEAVAFLVDPPLEPGLKIGYKVILEAAVATIPPRLRSILGLTPAAGALHGGRLAIAALRWALGYSPSWQLALIRSGAEIPPDKFNRTIDGRVESPPVPAYRGGAGTAT